MSFRLIAIPSVIIIIHSIITLVLSLRQCQKQPQQPHQCQHFICSIIGPKYNSHEMSEPYKDFHRTILIDRSDQNGDVHF